jgi:hypothetical protein
VLLGAVGIDLLGLGVAVVPAGGIGAIARWLRLYWAYDIPALAIFDRDQSDDADWSKRAELLATLREERHEYERLVQQGQPVSIGNAYVVMVKNFEVAMRALFPQVYEAHEQAVRSELGSASKPLVAREACRRLASEPSYAGWGSLRASAATLSSLVGRASNVT